MKIMKGGNDQNASGQYSNMTYSSNFLPRIDAEKGFDVHDAVLKANARTKKWITHSVVVGSVAVLTLAGIMVGLYLSGNLKEDKKEIPVVSENALHGRGDALTGGSMAGGAGKKKLDGNLNELGGISASTPRPTPPPPVQNNINPGLLLAATGTDLLDNVQDTVSDVAENINEAVSDVSENVNEAVNDVAETAADATADIVDDTADAASELFDGLDNTMMDSLNEMSDNVEDMVEDMSDKHETLSDPEILDVEDLLETMGEQVEDALELLGDPSDMLEALLEKAEDLNDMDGDDEDTSKESDSRDDDGDDNDSNEKENDSDDDDDSSDEKDDDDDDKDDDNDDDSDDDNDDDDDDDSDDNDDDSEDDDDDSDDDSDEKEDDDDSDDDKNDDSDSDDDSDDDKNDDSDSDDDDDDDKNDDSDSDDDDESEDTESDDETERGDADDWLDDADDIFEDIFGDRITPDDVEGASRDNEQDRDRDSEDSDSLITDFLSKSFDFSSPDKETDNENDDLYSSDSQISERVHDQVSDITEGFQNMGSNFFSGELPEAKLEPDFDIGDRFSFEPQSTNLDLKDTISEGVEAIRDFTNMDERGFGESNFNMDFQNPFSHVGEFISDMADTFADRPAPDFSTPEFSLDTSSFMPNRNDNYQNSWFGGGDRSYENSESEHSERTSDYDSDYHTETEESSSDSFW